ncbi:RNase III inhibitor [Paenibacillus pectinilyticus]|uniref:RNase III inhibitor n=1 Tax=Paenibacillus pectinilyticus TaxID=512399 RepID=A0A1C0ZTY9_9BACL|nr:RNase III inhibitor [Paenibacillus pectinilyticus]
MVHQTTLTVIKEDITQVEVDIIVNAANTSLLGGGGVDGAIHKAGGKDLLAECVKIRERQGGCKVGEAVITTAGNLPASYVIHTVGPVWNEGNNHVTDKLRACYINSLLLAREYNATSLAFPNISTGIYRFPKQLAAEIAIETVISHLDSRILEEQTINHVYFVCFDNDNYNIYLSMLSKYDTEIN